MSSQLSDSHVQSELPDWRVLAGAVHAVVHTGTFAKGFQFVERVTQLAEAADHHPDVNLRFGVVHLSLVSHDVGALTSRDVALARQISQAADEMDLEFDSASPQFVEIGIDAIDKPAVKPFWRALLGYVDKGASDLVDPTGVSPQVWFQEMDAPRPQRNRVHFDVHVPHDVAEQRVAEAITAGGRMVSDAHAPAFWVLADAEGNEACVCTWQGRD